MAVRKGGVQRVTSQKGPTRKLNRTAQIVLKCRYYLHIINDNILRMTD